ncbi:MAG: GxxExxY protein [Planctomycetes bacterium]|nr:GxxExxY protein [Planctomycetota bacterium]
MLHFELTGRIIGCAHNIYNAIGSGFMERVYQCGMAVELAEAGLEFRIEAPVPLFHKGHEIGDYYADLIVQDLVIVELKAVEALHEWHSVQLVNYLKVARKEVGLLLNFGPKGVQVDRKVHTLKRSA